MDSKNEKIIAKLSEFLKERDEIFFAVLHGSFIKSKSFRDVDCAVYLKNITGPVADYELDLETDLIMAGFLPAEADIRVLNTAPVSFRFNVIKDGHVLFCRDESTLIEFKEITVREYLDYSFLYANYMRDLHEHRL